MDKMREEVKAVITDLKFILDNMSMHVATRDALARNIVRLEQAAK